MFKVLVIEDETRVAELLKSGLEEHDYEADIALDGISGLRMFFQKQYDIVISDIILPKMGGFELCKEIRAVNQQIPILMLTALGSTDDKLEGFDAGADDYLTKPFDFRELLARIGVLLKHKDGEATQEVNVMEYAGLCVHTKTHDVFRDDKPVKLSPKEYELLLYMMQNAERIISRKEIMHNVWHIDFDPGTNFIDVYINYLRKKIDRDYEQKLIHTRTGVGFIFTNKI